MRVEQLPQHGLDVRDADRGERWQFEVGGSHGGVEDLRPRCRRAPILEQRPLRWSLDSGPGGSETSPQDQVIPAA